MNRKLAYLPLILLIAIAFSSCRKGEDDPFLSLRSRNARLTNDWTVVSQESNFKSVQGGGLTISKGIYDGAIEKATTDYIYDDGTTHTITSERTYSMNYKFNKDNTYEHVQFFPDNTVTIKGTWNFLKKDKEENIKDKEAIILFQTSVEYSAMPEANYTKEMMDGMILLIRGLSGKKITLEYDYSFSNADGSNTSERNTVTTLEKKK